MLGSSRATITRPSEYLTSRGAVPVRWDEMTRPGSCRGIRVRVLRDHPDRRGAAGEVLGSNNGRLTPLPATVVHHRAGIALEVELPVISGWLVLRPLQRQGRVFRAPAHLGEAVDPLSGTRWDARVVTGDQSS